MVNLSALFKPKRLAVMGVSLLAVIATKAIRSKDDDRLHPGWSRGCGDYFWRMQGSFLKKLHYLLLPGKMENYSISSYHR